MGRLFCSNCGESIEEGASFCVHCGHRLVRPVPMVNDSDRKEARQKAAKAVSNRKRTDKRISTLWIIVPFIVLTFTGIATVGIIFSEILNAFDDWEPDEEVPEIDDIYSRPDIIALQLTSSMVYVVIAMLSYNLILRQKRHFERERPLREAIMRFVEKTTGERYYYSLPTDAERKRIPLVWPIFILIPSLMGLLSLYVVANLDVSSEYIMLAILISLVTFVCYIMVLYMLHFLTKEMAGHHQRWCGFTLETKVELAKMGYAAGHLRTPAGLPDRSSVVYAVVTVFTGGLFAFYWFYVLIKDGNDHFEEQRLFEDDLLELLDKAPRPQREASRFTLQV